jgi:hypothetical protein
MSVEVFDEQTKTPGKSHLPRLKWGPWCRLLGSCPAATETLCSREGLADDTIALNEDRLIGYEVAERVLEHTVLRVAGDAARKPI